MTRHLGLRPLRDNLIASRPEEVSRSKSPCLVVFAGKPSIVGAFVNLLTDDEVTHRQQVALIFPPEPVNGIGTEASVVQAAPGLYEVWVTGPHGKFTVGAQDKATAVALAKLAVGRD